MPDRLATLYAEPTPRYLFLLFSGLCYLLRGLFPLVVAAVATYELIDAVHRPLDKWMPSLSTRATHTLTVLTLCIAGAAGLWAGAGHLLLLGQEAWTSVPALMDKALTSPLWLRVLELVPDAGVMLQHAKTYALEHVGSGLLVAKSVGEMLTLMTIGAIVAVIYAGEEEALSQLRANLPTTSPSATLWRWSSYVIAGLQAMIRTQVLVAVINAGLTLPILAWMGLPNVAGLTLLVFAGSLVPVLGNLIVGIVLTLLAGAIHGVSGAVGFVVVTTLLHKLESYVINPRIAARYLAVPSVMMIASLVLWEHLAGFVGFFVAFPSLIVAHRIRHEFVSTLRGHP